jgi:L-2-hydroxyglutarate oxidase
MYDYIVIGGGIVGASTAWQLIQRYPNRKILLLEKEQQLAQHQTGRNSGVIHSGIYYAPGSLKAEYCKAGVEATVEFCRANDIPFEQCGKLLVATNAAEHERMLALFERAKINGIDVELLDSSALRRLEPNVTGVGAIRVATTGIVDYGEISDCMVRLFADAGGEVRLDACVTGLRERADTVKIDINDGQQQEEAGFLICCGGLMADRLARMQGIAIDFEIIPYRGEYYRLPDHRSGIINHLIYPIPDPALPFLGVHLTRMIDDATTVGPNAVQGWKREGYGHFNFSVTDAASMLKFPGFWKVLGSNLKNGLHETWNSLWKPGYLKQVQKYCPTLRLSDLKPHPTGVRAQAVMRDGALVDDFLFAETARSLHVCNAPSPAATASIPIGEHIVQRVATANELT